MSKKECEECSDDEDAEVMEIRGHVVDPGIHWSTVHERHIVHVFTGLEMYRNLKLPNGDDRLIRKLLVESHDKQKRMTIDYEIETREIIEVRYRWLVGRSQWIVTWCKAGLRNAAPDTIIDRMDQRCSEIFALNESKCIVTKFYRFNKRTFLFHLRFDVIVWEQYNNIIYYYDDSNNKYYYNDNNDNDNEIIIIFIITVIMCISRSLNATKNRSHPKYTFTPKSDQFWISPAASSEILHRTLWSLLRWKMIILLILTTWHIHSSLKGWENVRFELGSERSGRKSSVQSWGRFRKWTSRRLPDLTSGRIHSCVSFAFRSWTWTLLGLLAPITMETDHHGDRHQYPPNNPVWPAYR